ncbi:unnamed protein product [Paramecium pentaurelia]|uniref:Uncharacterized protein n=1 Tax=Paramecium pentaurelia TaxID=43138 RepID=A0A8S1XDI1_9CILI|nr:unnamed protein product [Paramecium pentaurelia]
MQYDRSLLTEDIIGAQPKHRKVNMNRVLPNQLPLEEQLRLQKQIPHQDIRFGRRRYENDVHHFCNICLPQEHQYFDKRNTIKTSKHFYFLLDREYVIYYENLISKNMK